MKLKLMLQSLSPLALLTIIQNFSFVLFGLLKAQFGTGLQKTKSS